jgi:hypothetical protein
MSVVNNWSDAGTTELKEESCIGGLLERGR